MKILNLVKYILASIPIVVILLLIGIIAVNFFMTPITNTLGIMLALCIPVAVGFIAWCDVSIRFWLKRINKKEAPHGPIK